MKNNNKRIANYMIYDAVMKLLDFYQKDLKEDIGEIKEVMTHCQKHRLPNLEQKLSKHIDESEFKKGNLVISKKMFIGIITGVVGALKLPELWSFLRELLNG